MKSDELVSRLHDVVGRHAVNTTGDIPAAVLREMQLDMFDVFHDAYEYAPCPHPANKVQHGRCFLCGRKIADAKA